MHESARIRQVHKHLKAFDVLAYKIQTSFNNGIADAYYAGPRGNIWIEYKQIKFPKRTNTIITPKLSALQKHFLTKHNTFGLSCWVIIFSDKGHFILKSRDYWEIGILACVAETTFKSYKELADEILQSIS